MTRGRAWTGASLLLATVALGGGVGCGAREDPPPPTTQPVEPSTPPPPPVAAPCASAEPGALVMSFSVQGTHGMDFSETLSIGCDGEVVLDAPRPWTTELRERPGRYAHRIDAARVAQLRELAVRLARPVPIPSLPPQGADVSVYAYTTPPAGHALRPGEGAADGEAAAILSSLTSEIVASLPPMQVCELIVALEPSVYPLRAGREGTVLVSLRNPASHPIHMGLPRLSEAIHVVANGTEIGRVAPDALSVLMLPDMRILGELDDTERHARTVIEIPAGAAPWMAFTIVPPNAGPLAARARVDARVSCSAPTDVDATLPTHTYESAEVTLTVGADGP